MFTSEKIIIKTMNSRKKRTMSRMNVWGTSFFSDSIDLFFRVIFAGHLLTVSDAKSTITIILA
jgi:hypothetical protein